MFIIETFGALIKIAEALLKTGGLSKFSLRSFKVIPSASKINAMSFKLAFKPTMDNVWLIVIASTKLSKSPLKIKSVKLRFL